MKRTVLPLLALLSLVLSGCGGSNGSDSNGGGGQFEGLYDVVLSREGSPVRIEGPMTIDEDGDVNGTFEGDEFGTAVLDGRVSSSGDFVGTATQNGQATELTGEFEFDSNRNLTGFVRLIEDGEVVQTNLTGTRR